MKNRPIIITILAALIIVGIFVFIKNRDAAVITTPVIGCYQAELGQDVYSLDVASQDGTSVSGTLVFDNFEKDSSYGPFTGTYQGDILLGEYVFNSEGVQSTMEIAFKKTDKGFVRGFGPLTTTGNRFADMNEIAYDSSVVFAPSAEQCPTQPN